MSDELIAAITALRADLARQHSEITRRLDAILAVLSPPRPPGLNPLGALTSARTHYRTERMLADLQAALNHGTGTATVLPLPRREEGEP